MFGCAADCCDVFLAISFSLSLPCAMDRLPGMPEFLLGVLHDAGILLEQHRGAALSHLSAQ